ncbi:MAG TPA: enoyl-CoA hydratase/isomerase family protein [Afipia sp.]|nr:MULTISPECIES: enoyl-CoA hydratase/isomerase family protein [unclassified Afipia]MAH69036.1 enoyl-CoA hydratase/isomerase family protein [Afipia sp.]OUX61800.1 MAG: 3-hydroxyisobutyryl-CoA hydrolase [Afipia sp. TMED4]HAO41696.1 enoyl-CoA hydratase/isomerase family protein [Afipia sp.]HAP48311.1 enoyl-CoA hydratase/isomerase family protein [Afipia sp.]HAQ94447.1 enoyl-CoA hydratase/isomerase family protein [Afipia sp.]
MSAHAAMTETPEKDVIICREGAAGIIRLNRPKTINALTLEMTREIVTALDTFETDPGVSLVLLEGAGERGLCAGGDIRGLYESAKAGGDLGPVFWREEYILNARIPDFPKPYVAYMDGLVMGGGVGLSAHSAHRIVTEKTKMAMPEVGLGFFPDVGGTWLLSRAPGEIGTYFALTGQTMSGADAVYAGAADVLIATKEWPALRDALTNAPLQARDNDVRGILARFGIQDGQAPIAKHRDLIDRAFAHDTVEEIVTALKGDGSEFALAALKALSEKSPTALKVTLELLRRARNSKSLKECLIREYNSALAVFTSAEFVEGVRAAIIDKDRNPKWSPSRIEDVTPEIVGKYFTPNGKYTLVFPD